MPTRNVPEDFHKVTLRRWRVIEVERHNGIRSRHLWGHDVTNNIGRASSAIMEFDLRAMVATTRSGKNYWLVGLPGNSRLGKCAWENWCSNNQIASTLDVTKDYMNIDQMSADELSNIHLTLSRQGSL